MSRTAGARRPDDRPAAGDGRPPAPVPADPGGWVRCARYELRDGVMRVRLVPVREVFARMRLVVRDLARETGREIDLVLTGTALRARHDGRTWYLCGPGCVQAFTDDPARYAG